MGIVEKMADNFTEERLSLKLLEEMAELSEVLLKRITKSEDLKPPLAKVIEEMGDINFRMKCLMFKLAIAPEVLERMIEKEKQIAKWYTDNFEKINQ